MILYHGTSREAYFAIKKNGFVNAYFTSCRDIALRYAQDRSRGIASEPIVLKVEVDENCLRYDEVAMEYPVGVTEEAKTEKLKAILEKNPQWVKDGVICIPESAWIVSLDCVKSVKTVGVIPASKILFTHRK